MYEVTKATVVKDGVPVKTYCLNAKTENLEETRAYVKRTYADEYVQGIDVDLQYKEVR